MPTYTGEFRNISIIDTYDGMGHSLGLSNQPATKGEVNEKLEHLAHLYNEWATYFMHNLDHINVRRLFTEYCDIRSKDGETVISGPVLTMYDKQAIPVLRLKMGYDAVSLDFVYQLMNAAGDITVNIDSSGDLTVERGLFKGSITIGTGNNVFKADSNGIYLGNADFATAPFKVGIDGSATATNLTVTGGSIDVATDVKVGSNIMLCLGASASSNIYFGDGYDDAYGLIRSDPVNGNLVIGFPNVVGGAYISILPGGTIDCANAAFASLSDGTSAYATEAFVTGQGYITGTTGFTGTRVIGAETYTWSNGVLVSVV